MLEIIIHSIILSILPISELRGGIPYAVANGVDIVPAFFICVLANAMVAPIAFIFLETVHKLLYKIALYRKFFDFWVIRTRKKIEKSIAQYGYWGLMLFVAIPLPATGAYSGVLAAWLLEMNRKKSFLFIALGVLIAGIVVAIATLTGLELLKIFLK